MNVESRRILLVEDDPNDLLLIQRAFKKAGVDTRLETVGDGEQAVAYLSGQGKYAGKDSCSLPAMLLLDLKLPRKSGLEVLDWLRRQPLLKRLPVVVLTSSRQTADVNRAYDLGVNSYLVKPVTSEALVELVREVDSYWVARNEKPDMSAA